MDLNYKYIENKSTTQNKSAEHSFFFFLFFYRKNRLCLKIHTISSMFFVEFFLLAINYFFESDNMYVIWWRKMVTVYTELSVKDQEKQQSLQRSIITHENSNLIMPFLVQNDNKNDKLHDDYESLKKTKLFFLLKRRSISLKSIKL